MMSRYKFFLVASALIFSSIFLIAQSADAVTNTCAQANAQVTCTPDYACGGGGTQCKTNAYITALPANPNTTFSCSSCSSTCNGGYADCDGNGAGTSTANGCETAVPSGACDPDGAGPLTATDGTWTGSSCPARTCTAN